MFPDSLHPTKTSEISLQHPNKPATDFSPRRVNISDRRVDLKANSSYQPVAFLFLRDNKGNEANLQNTRQTTALVTETVEMAAPAAGNPGPVRRGARHLGLLE